jgi:hypothetical protein
MSLKGHYTPLQLNCLGAFLQSSGFNINATALGYMGSSTSNTTYTTRGTVYTATVLDSLATAMSLAYAKIGTNPSTNVSQSVYNNLIAIGSASIPALGNSKPSTYTGTYTNDYSKYGFLRLVALQAYNEFHINNGSYSDFISTFNTCESFKNRSNKLIGSFGSSTTYLKGIFSSMSDLITSDITGVSISTLYWGQDLIATGRSIDLSTIDEFGLPSNLLRTLSVNKALTSSVNLALLSSGLTSTEITNILNGSTATIAQEKLIYGSFNVILGSDLANVCVLLNCQTPNLNSLADLLDPKKLFPNSYTTLTVPQYNSIPLPTNSKTYYPIYFGGQPNIRIPLLGIRLRNILPEPLAYVCDAFSITMMQITRIKTINIEKFAQVVTNLENVADLNVGSTNVPMDTALATSSLTTIAKGSGPGGIYYSTDFFGAMSGVSYDWKNLQSLITNLQSGTLSGIYGNMVSLLNSAGPYNTQLTTYINSANTEISNILAGNQPQAQQLNTLYSKFGSNLLKEQNARTLALPGLTDLTTTVNDVYSFMDSLEQYATQTEDYGPSLVLEGIADITTIGGNCLIGSMREIRNALRLGLAGGVLDNNVNSENLLLPRISGTTSNQNPLNGYTNTSITSNIPIITGATTTPGSLAGSPEVKLIPPNLSIFNLPVKSSVLTPQEAVAHVELCNCDCWQNLV